MHRAREPMANSRRADSPRSDQFETRCCRSAGQGRAVARSAGNSRGACCAVVACVLVLSGWPLRVDASSPTAAGHDRSPVDLALLPDEQLLVCANQTGDSLSLIDVVTGKVLDEVACGHRPSAVAV